MVKKHGFHLFFLFSKLPISDVMVFHCVCQACRMTTRPSWWRLRKPCTSCMLVRKPSGNRTRQKPRWRRWSTRPLLHLPLHGWMLWRRAHLLVELWAMQTLYFLQPIHIHITCYCYHLIPQNDGRFFLQGLRVGDEVIEFGSVNAGNFQNLQNIASVVQHSEGVIYCRFCNFRFEWQK